MWHSLRSDGIQRTILRAAAIKSPTLGERRRKSLLWCLDKAGKISEFRNDAVHTFFEYGPGERGIEFEPSEWAAPLYRSEKLNRVGYKKLFRFATGDLRQLSEYAISIAGSLLDEKRGWRRHPFPKRPLLRSIQLVQQSPQDRTTINSAQQNTSASVNHGLSNFAPTANEAPPYQYVVTRGLPRYVDDVFGIPGSVTTEIWVAGTARRWRFGNDDRGDSLFINARPHPISMRWSLWIFRRQRERQCTANAPQFAPNFITR